MAVFVGADYHARVANPRGGLQLHGGEERSSQCQPPGIEVQMLLPTASCYRSGQEENNTVKHWME